MKKVSLLSNVYFGGAMQKTFSALSLIIASSLFSGAVWSATPAELNQAKRIHERLTGVPPTDADLNAMADLIAGPGSLGGYSGLEAAAYYAITTSQRKSEFYTTHLKNFFVQYTNIDDNPLPFLNDAAATMIGMVRDDVPFDQALYGDILYIPGTGGYSASNNNSYEALDRSHADLSNLSVLQASTQSAHSPVTGLEGSTPKFAGVTTTRAWGEAYYSAGTNRRVLRSITMNFMCRDLEQLKDTTRSPDRIRQDVTRSPGGDSSIYLSSCMGCHAGMDPLTGAFAYYEWADDHLTYNSHIKHNPDGGVLHKFLINAGNFPQGYITHDESWENYWREGKNAELGWGESTLTAASTQPPKINPPNGTGLTNSGTGPKTMGEEVASSKAFGDCQVERVYLDICKHAPTDADSDAVNAIQDAFRVGFDMKDVFIKTAAMCAGN